MILQQGGFWYPEMLSLWSQKDIMMKEMGGVEGSLSTPSDKTTNLRIVLESLGINISHDQEPSSWTTTNQVEEAERTTPFDHGGGGKSLKRECKSNTKRIQIIMIKVRYIK